MLQIVHGICKYLCLIETVQCFEKVAQIASYAVQILEI